MRQVLGLILILSVSKILKSKLLTGLGVDEFVFLLLRMRGLGEELVKNMEVLLLIGSGDDSGFLEEVVINFCVLDLPGVAVHHDGEIFAEPARIVVSDGFGISECLKDGVG